MATFEQLRKLGHPICASCGILVSADGWTGGINEGTDSKAENLKCGCRYCWHCSDNRGRHEDHDPNCNEPIPAKPPERTQ